MNPLVTTDLIKGFLKTLDSKNAADKELIDLLQSSQLQSILNQNSKDFAIQLNNLIHVSSSLVNTDPTKKHEGVKDVYGEIEYLMEFESKDLGGVVWNMRIDDDLKKYISNVNLLAQFSNSFLFKNSSPVHAAIVLTTMILNSKQNVVIYDRDLSGDVAEKFKAFYPAVINHLINKKELRIIIDNHNQEETPICKLLIYLKGQFPDKLDVKKASDDFKESVKAIFGYKMNFAVSDGISYRFEEYEEDTNSIIPIRKAFCNFNDKNISSQLKSVFDSYFGKCESIFS